MRRYGSGSEDKINKLIAAESIATGVPEPEQDESLKFGVRADTGTVQITDVQMIGASEIARGIGKVHVHVETDAEVRGVYFLLNERNGSQQYSANQDISLNVSEGTYEISRIEILDAFGRERSFSQKDLPDNIDLSEIKITVISPSTWLEKQLEKGINHIELERLEMNQYNLSSLTIPAGMTLTVGSMGIGADATLVCNGQLTVTEYMSIDNTAIIQRGEQGQIQSRSTSVNGAPDSWLNLISGMDHKSCLYR